MKYFWFVLVSAITLALIFAGNHSFKTGDRHLPPLLKFINPFHGFWQNAEAHKDFRDQQFQIPSLSGSVEVVFDDRKVPHVFASTAKDAFFVQGYLEASDRLWQMDFSTKAAAGRLSELSGMKMKNYDLNKRRIGMVWAAENAVKGWKKYPEEYELLVAYITGVNHYIDQLKPKDLPIEFKLINYKPEKWSDLKSALFFKSMALTLCSWEADLQHTNLINHFGKETFDFLFPDYFEDQSPVIPSEKEWTFKPENSNSSNPVPYIGDAIKQQYFEKAPEGIGSNNWAVSGSKTSSGKPILCNDPHLNLTLPSIWYEIHLVTPESNAYGVTLPGIPGIIIGFNDNIAWGMTNVGQDVSDWVHIEWENEEKTKYNIDGETYDVDYRVDEYKVRGAQSFFDTVKYTKWGPIPFAKSERGYSDLALQWIAHYEPDMPELAVFANINKSNNFEEFNKFSDQYISPAQNFIFASKEGDIALKVNGRFPITNRQKSKFIKPGNSGDSDWREYIPRDQIPKILNPERAFVSSANQHSTDESYPYEYTGSFEAFRGRILNEELAAMDGIDVEDMMELHANNKSVKARTALPLMLDLIESKIDSSDQQLFQQLKDWNFEYDRESIGASIFETWFNWVDNNCWDELTSLKDSFLIRTPKSWRIIDLMEKEPFNEFFDLINTPEKESAVELCYAGFKYTKTKLEGVDDESLEWGNFRDFSVNHLANIPAFSELNLNVSGHGDVLNANEDNHGPSWRMIVSLTEPVEAYGIFPGGQSGNPGSKYYRNSIEKWIEGKYHQLHFTSDPTTLKADALMKWKFE